MNIKNKIILVYPGEIGLYMRDKMHPIIQDNFITRRFLTYVLRRKVTLPLSLLTLVSYLQQAAFEVVIIDGRVEHALERLRNEINDQVLFVGISALTGNMIHYGLFCAKYVRRHDPLIPIVWGGVHVTIAPQESLLTSEYVDIVVRGEGEVTIAELAKTLRNSGNLSPVLGISYKKNGEIYHNADRPFIDFDEQAEIDYDIIPMDWYDTKDTLLYQSERGCPHRCAFCDVLVVHRGKFRKKTAETVLEDFKKLNAKFKPSCIFLVDDCFFADLNRAQAIIDGLIKLNLGVSWHASCRAQYFQRTNVEFWKKAKQSGLNDVYVGSESGSQKILDYIKKDCTVDDILSGAKQITDAGMGFITNFMCGFPGETVEDTQKTIELIDYLNSTYGEKMIIGKIFIYAPCPGTPLYLEAQKAGFLPPKTLEEWGNFIIGDRSHSEWHPLINYLTAVSLSSRWGRKFSFKTSINRLRRFNIPGILMDILGHIAYGRWNKRKFNYGVDLKILRFIIRNFYKV